MKSFSRVIKLTAFLLIFSLFPISASAQVPTKTSVVYTRTDGKIFITGSSRYKSYVKKAMSRWNAVKNVFVWTNDKSYADIVIQDSNAYKRNSKTGQNTLASYSTGKIVFYHNNLKKKDSKRKLSTAIHELGHAVGLMHTTSGSYSMMEPSQKYRPKSLKISSADKTAMKNYYNRSMATIKKEQKDNLAIRDYKKAWVLPYNYSVNLNRVMRIKSISSTNNSVVSPYFTKGNYVFEGVRGIKTNNKSGTATITVKTNNKTYRYKIIVADIKSDKSTVKTGESATISAPGVIVSDWSVEGVPTTDWNITYDKKQKTYVANEVELPGGKAVIAKKTWNGVSIRGISKGLVRVKIGPVVVSEITIK